MWREINIIFSLNCKVELHRRYADFWWKILSQRQRDMVTGRQTDRHRQADRQTDRQKDRQAGRQAGSSRFRSQARAVLVTEVY